MENIILTNWQKGKANKYNIKITDIIVEKKAYCTIHDKPVKHPEVDIKKYPCTCGQYEVFGFIDKLKGKCKECAWFKKNKLLNK